MKRKIFVIFKIKNFNIMMQILLQITISIVVSLHAHLKFQIANDTALERDSYCLLFIWL